VDEFPMERESVMFQIVGSKPPFNLPLRGRLADASHDMFDSQLFTVPVEGELTLPNTPELRPMIRQSLTWFTELMHRPVKQTDHILRCAFSEVLAAGYEATVVVKDTHKPFRRYKFQIALP
jgi:hypothetical protein